MKKSNPTIKAQILRSAFYLLLAVCAIPFALAQRNATKRGVVSKFAAAPAASGAAQATRLSGVHPKAASQFNVTSQSNAGSRLLPYDVRVVPAWRLSNKAASGPTGGAAVKNLRMPVYPQVVLYDQYDNDLNDGIVSADRTDDPSFSAEAADNFVVPSGQTWTVTEVDIRSPVGFGSPTSFAVTFYLDNGSGLPGTQVYTASGLAVTGNPDYVITLTTPAVLAAGTYWVSAVGTITGGNWYWEGRSITNNTFATAWRNPGGGWGVGCTDWARLQDCIGISWPDQMFRIVGTTSGGGTPTPTATATPTCTAGGGTPGPWMTASPYPTTIVRYGFAQTATHFYVFGGEDNGFTTNAVNRMDLATGMWEARAPMPFSGEAPTCALMESTGIVYCADGNATNSFATYNIASDTWTSLAPDPFVAEHYGSASGAFDGKVFVAGGTNNFSSAVDVYDVASNTWSAGTAAPNGYLLAGYQQVGQFLYVVGGWTGFAPNGLTTTTRLDMSSAPGVWENGPAFTMGRADFGLAYDAGTNKLYALGGDLPNDGNFFNSTNELDELDLSAWPGGTWVMSPPNLPLPNRQANQAGFFGNGDIWSVGGIDGVTFQFLLDVYHRNNVGCGGPSPTPTGTPSATPTASPSATATPTGTATATVTPTATPTTTPTATATATPTPTTPRPTPTPRPRPTPLPRPTPRLQ